MLYLGPEEKTAKEAPIPDWPGCFQRLAANARDPRLRQFYRAGVVAADTPLSEVPFVAVDFETTGLDPEIHGIVSIGLVPFDIRRIHCRRARHWIVKPRKPLGKESVVIHGITHTDVRQAPDLLRILEPLLAALAGRILVVHHRGIERAFFDAALRARLGEGIRFPVVDTMDLEARLHRGQAAGFWARLLGRKPVSIRLADSRSRYHLPYYQPHHALTDALATAELLQAQIAHHYTPDTRIGDIWR